MRPTAGTLFVHAGHVPQFDGVVAAPRCQSAAVRAERYRLDFIGVALQGVQQHDLCRRCTRIICRRRGWLAGLHLGWKAPQLHPARRRR